MKKSFFAQHESALSQVQGQSANTKDFKWYEDSVPCRTACPADTDIPGYLEAIYKKDFDKIQDAIIQELNNRNHCISLGGDHSITFPIIEAYFKHYSKINIIQFDAHPDLYEKFDNNPFSHASPFARILENQLSGKLIQIGIRTLNEHQRKQADRYNVSIITMNEFSPELKLKFNGPVYISIDLDGSEIEVHRLSEEGVFGLKKGIKYKKIT